MQGAVLNKGGGPHQPLLPTPCCFLQSCTFQEKGVSLTAPLKSPSLSLHCPGEGPSAFQQSPVPSRELWEEDHCTPSTPHITFLSRCVVGRQPSLQSWGRFGSTLRSPALRVGNKVRGLQSLCRGWVHQPSLPPAGPPLSPILQLLLAADLELSSTLGG